MTGFLSTSASEYVGMFAQATQVWSIDISVHICKHTLCSRVCTCACVHAVCSLALGDKGRGIQHVYAGHLFKLPVLGIFCAIMRKNRGVVRIFPISWREWVCVCVCAHTHAQCTALGCEPRDRRKVSRLLQSQIRCHVPTRPLHVTSLKDPFLFY